MAEDRKEQGAGIDGYLFRLIATFEAAAMQQLGKIAHPVTGDVEVSLEGARDSIEMLAMVQRKTDGNLSGDEGRLLQHVLYQLRMNYVDVARAEGAAGSEPEAGDEPAAAGDKPGAGETKAEDDPAAAGGETGSADRTGEVEPEEASGGEPGEAGPDDDR
jgi:hypothetical protein